MAGEDQDLMLPREVGQFASHCPRPLRIEVDQHIIHNQRQCSGPPSELPGKAETNAEIELLDRTTAQFLGPFPLGVTVNDHEALAVLVLKNRAIRAARLVRI
jgi:hypothetical protein